MYIYPEFYLKLSTLFSIIPNFIKSSIKMSWNVNSTWKKKHAPLCLLMLLLILTIGHTPSHSTSKGGRAQGVPWNLPSKRTQKGHGECKFKENQWRLEGKSCATPATPEMFYSTNKIPKLKLPKHKLVRHFFPKTSTGHWDVLPHLLEFVPLMSSTLPRWLPTHHCTKQRATNFISI